MAAYTKYIPVKGKVETLLDISPNRPIKPFHVKTLALAMKSGEWKPEISPLFFYPDGKLADGQHRLWAWLEAGCPDGVFFYAAVIQVSDITKIDAGCKRSTADHAKMLGFPIGNRGIAVARVALSLEQGSYSQSRQVVSHDMVIDAANRYGVGSFLSRLLPACVCGTIAWIASKHDVDEFWVQLREGVGLAKTDPAFHLRNAALTTVIGTASDREVLVVKTVRAWNAYAKGEPMSTLKAGARPFSWIPLEAPR